MLQACMRCMCGRLYLNELPLTANVLKSSLQMVDRGWGRALKNLKLRAQWNTGDRSFDWVKCVSLAHTWGDSTWYWSTSLPQEPFVDATILGSLRTIATCTKSLLEVRLLYRELVFIINSLWIYFTAPSAFKASMSPALIPSTSLKTSSVCCPSRGGAVLILGLLSLYLTGVLTSFIGPKNLWSTVLIMPLAKTCLWFKVPWISLTAEYGNPEPS